MEFPEKKQPYNVWLQKSQMSDFRHRLFVTAVFGSDLADSLKFHIATVQGSNL